MLRPHRALFRRRLRNFAWPFLCGALFFCASCAGVSPEQRAFYSYVDAQGNIVTVSRENSVDSEASFKEEQGAPAGESKEGSQESVIAEEHASQDEALDVSAPKDAVPPPRQASNPDELWSMSDESYVTSDEFENESERKERERFVSYPDETGRLVTHPVDMAAAKKASEEAEAGALDLGENVLPEVGAVTRWSTINADCCQNVLTKKRTLSDGDAKPVNIMAKPRESIFVENHRPGKAFLLDPSVKLIQLQSWDKKGYLYPQALFLDENGIPLSRVVQIFTRTKAQTWASQAYLVGEIPMEPGAKWLVLFLDYAQTAPDGTVSQNKINLKYEDMDMPLTLRGELVVRATSGVF